MFSLIRTYFMDVFHTTYVKNTTFQKKESKNTLFTKIKVITDKQWSICKISIYVILLKANHEPLQKKLVKYWKKTVKNKPIIAIVRIIL